MDTRLITFLYMLELFTKYDVYITFNITLWIHIQWKTNSFLFVFIQYVHSSSNGFDIFTKEQISVTWHVLFSSSVHILKLNEVYAMWQCWKWKWGILFIELRNLQINVHIYIHSLGFSLHLVCIERYITYDFFSASKKQAFSNDVEVMSFSIYQRQQSMLYTFIFFSTS